MTGTVELPLWALVIIGVLALWVLAERLLLPGVRWFFRRRVNFVIEQLNRRLKLKLPTFSLTKRKVLVDRLTYDPAVLEEVRRFCERTGTPWDVALARAESYAKEIVPSLNAYVYLGIANIIARRLIRRFYRVRLAYAEQLGLEKLDRQASIVFVINHRSNMDYVLVAYLALKHTLLSYAVGEWARIWPFQQLIQALGGFFVRRDSGNELYRRVLERYVQMAVEGGVVQAMFPEGGLSRDGAFREPRIGLFDYVLRDFDPQGERDVLFIPVGVNYDWVLEDRRLLRDAGKLKAERKSTWYAMFSALRYLGRRVRKRFRGEWYRMGYASAAFGEPVSLRQWCLAGQLDMRALPREQRIKQTQRFAAHLLERIGEVVPALPVPVMCWIFLSAPRRAWSREALQEAFAAAVERIEDSGSAYVPRRAPPYAVELGLRILKLRGMVKGDDAGYRLVAGERALFRYYANSVVQLLGAPSRGLPGAPARQGARRAGSRRAQRSTKARSMT